MRLSPIRRPKPKYRCCTVLLPIKISLQRTTQTPYPFCIPAQRIRKKASRFLATQISLSSPAPRALSVLARSARLRQPGPSSPTAAGAELPRALGGRPGPSLPARASGGRAGAPPRPRPRRPAGPELARARPFRCSAASLVSSSRAPAASSSFCVRCWSSGFFGCGFLFMCVTRTVKIGSALLEIV